MIEEIVPIKDKEFLKIAHFEEIQKEIENWIQNLEEKLKEIPYSDVGVVRINELKAQIEILKELKGDINE